MKVKTVQQHKNNSLTFQYYLLGGTLTAAMGGVLWSQPEETIPGDMERGCFSKPWRDLPENFQENLNFLKSYQPQNKKVKRLRILVHGPVGAGKSSIINSVDSVFQHRITGQAVVDAVTGGSITDKYRTYKISNGSGGFYSFVFNDTMGFERPDGRGVHVEDIKLALKGHVKEGYKFNPREPLTEGDFYNPTPTLDDRVHVLVSVVSAESVSLMSAEDVKKMREVRLTASEMGIPQLAILTKIDEACPEVNENIKYTYWSKFLKEQVKKCSSLLGIPLNYTFLVKNYHSEIRTNDDIDALILMALRQMVCFGEDFLNNQQD